MLRHVRGPRILDVGCTNHVPAIDSPRWLHGQLHRTFPGGRIVGVDLDAENVRTLHAAGFSDTLVMDAEELDLDERFDTIVAGELLEHLSNPGRFLGAARAHLTPGGRLVLSTPYVFALQYALKALTMYPNTSPNPQHTCWFCPQTLAELAGRHGFSVISLELVEDYPESRSPASRAFTGAMRTFGDLLPRRLRCNTMIAVLEPTLANADDPSDGRRRAGVPVR
jgi:2-polyprenyl-3-methyl-5-hydroxy-6-metoxy-1,4-benzoquinol methylase